MKLAIKPATALLRFTILLSGFLCSQSVLADNHSRFQIIPVTESVYAFVGELGNRSAENLGNNATFGLVVTEAGAVLIDPGATAAGAKAIHDLVRRVTDKPVVKVINTGGQDHRWLGNAYFRRLGAEIIASQAAVEDQKKRATDQLFVLSNLVGEFEARETEPVYADHQFPASLLFQLGGVEFEVYHHGPAHTPGDSFIWLPQQSVVFAGDIVYMERMLGVIDVSSSSNWIEAFRAMARFEPRYVVPGHGKPTDLPHAMRDTLGYLAFLRQAVADFIEEGKDIADIGTLDQSEFSYLVNFDLLAGRNAQQVFTEMEWE